jgi:hypothetical protein
LNFDPVYEFIDWLKTVQIAGALTAFHLAVLLAALIVGGLLYGTFVPKKRARKYMIDVICNDCGWLGQVSKFTKVCMQCKSPAVRMLNREEAEAAKKRQRAKGR